MLASQIFASLAIFAAATSATQAAWDKVPDVPSVPGASESWSTFKNDATKRSIAASTDDKSLARRELKIVEPGLDTRAQSDFHWWTEERKNATIHDYRICLAGDDRTEVVWCMMQDKYVDFYNRLLDSGKQEPVLRKERDALKSTKKKLTAAVAALSVLLGLAVIAIIGLLALTHIKRKRLDRQQPKEIPLAGSRVNGEPLFAERS